MGPDSEATGRKKPAGATQSVPTFAEPTIVHVRKLTPETVARWNLGNVEFVVIEPVPGGMRVRPASLEDQVRHEREAGVGRVTYSLSEFLDEFGSAPTNPAPTFDRLLQFTRDYRKLTQEQQQLFRAAAKKLVAPLSTTPPGVPGEPFVRELNGPPGFFELRLNAELRAVYTFGPSVRRAEPHIIWCRIGGEEVRDKQTAVREAITGA